MKLALAHEMQQLDRAAIDQYNIPGIVLMENAGCGTVDYMLRELGSVANKSALIVVGPGNNGGDGLVIARKIHKLGGFPFIIYLVDPKKFKGDSLINYNSVTQLKLPFKVMLDAESFENLSIDELGLEPNNNFWAIVDAVFGTGLQRSLTGHFLAAVNFMNYLSKTYATPLIAVDIPSGINADNGMVLGGSACADHTVTYGLAKPGHFMHGGIQSGKLHVVDIGIPPAVVNNAELKGEYMDTSLLDVFANRSPSSHKGNYGHLLVLAGSAGKCGAAIISGLGALRIGTGLVTLAVPADLRTVFDSSLYEAMTLLMPVSRKYPSIDDYSVIIENLTGKTALVIGPGIGTAEKTQELILKLYCEANLPMVIDADALNILALEPQYIANPPAPRILTPHPGEMARLTGLSTKDIQAERLNTTLDFTASTNTASSNVTTILKGAGTIVCDPSGTWAINTTGNPGMATGGMGDVLSGIIGGILSQGIAPQVASRVGVYIHGLAADKLATKQRFGYLASEVADIIPQIITSHTQNNSINQGDSIC